MEFNPLISECQSDKLHSYFNYVFEAKITITSEFKIFHR